MRVTAFCGRCAAAVEALVRASEPCAPLHHGIVERLLFNHRLWGYGAPQALQEALLRAQRAFIAADPIAFRRMVGLLHFQFCVSLNEGVMVICSLGSCWNVVR